MVLGLHKDLAIRGNPTDGREMVIGELDSQNGRLAYRGVGGDGHWEQVKTRLIYSSTHTRVHPSALAFFLAHPIAALSTPGSQLHRAE
jgi:hypothetical protein